MGRAIVQMVRAAIAALLALSATGQAAPPPPIVVTGGWARATLPGQPVAAGYLTIVNHSPRSDRLLAARSPRARSVTLHSSELSRGVSRMRALGSGLTIAAGRRAQFAPGSLHLMLDGLGAPLRPGQRVPLVLRFARAGEIATTLVVRSPGSSTGGHDHAR